MPTLLALDTSTEACSCALAHAGEISEKFAVIPRQHTNQLLPMIHALMSEGGLTFNQLDAIAFGKGPGSFTGLRIAAGVAQGIAFAANLPVVPVSTLAALAVEAVDGGSGMVFSCLDARIDEIYYGWYQVQDGVPQLIGDEQLRRPELVETAVPVSDGNCIAAGNGLHYRDRLPRSLLQSFGSLRPELLPRSRHIAAIAAAMFARGATVTAEQIEPVYLRDKVTHHQ
ncbi:MAG TPA: tRNA (adenosine(37)-N6)-threonylcarbamoyltransferase complex dimerization subunit type 1 TsaB [Candidatus Acidoferrum sp.]|nr:tRNA (adenosine(37)-N6)-threonylcarbamoyltransferase complex dimerization subunit type 1 TsaB [Candidatus Acidoferrum sp.]